MEADGQDNAKVVSSLIWKLIVFQKQADIQTLALERETNVEAKVEARCKRIEMEAKVEAKVQAKVGTKVETKTHQRLEQKGKKALSLTGLDRKVVDLMRQAGVQKCRATQSGK